MELGPRNISVNAVLPGFTKTDMVLADKSAEQISALVRTISDKSMLGRVGEPEDIAHAAVYLAADESSWVTGSSLMIDGGYTCQ